MPFQKGNKLSKGRPKGTKNERTILVEHLASQFKLDPFQILLMFANGDWQGLGYDSEVYVMENASGATKIGYTISPEMRLVAAKEAAQYLYSKKKSEIELPEVEEPIDVYSIDEKKKLLIQAKKEIEKLEKEINEPILNADITNEE